MSVWRGVVIFAFLFIVIGFLWIATRPDEPVVVEKTLAQKLLDEYNTSYKPYITPQNYNVSVVRKRAIGDGNFTSANLTELQEWMVTYFRRTGDYDKKRPYRTIEDKEGNHISLHLLEYSIILNKDPNADTYLLDVELKYAGDESPRNHSALLCFFGKRVFISDLTIQKEDLNYVCRLALPVECVYIIIGNTYITEYNVKYAFSESEQVYFENGNEDFVYWLEKHIEKYKN